MFQNDDNIGNYRGNDPSTPTQPSAALGDEFDQTFRKLHGLPGTTETGVASKRIVHPLTGVTQDWTVQRIRQQEEGDWLLVTRGQGRELLRIVIPPQITSRIDRTYDTATKKTRSRVARATIERRRLEGEDIGAALRDPAVQAKARAARRAKAAKKK